MEYKTDIGSAAKAQKEINQLKSEIASLGNINIDAIEEYKRVSERYEFLSTQREDLTQAKDSLEKIIREMQGCPTPRTYWRAEWRSTYSRRAKSCKI